jgi:hypothetical protein
MKNFGMIVGVPVDDQQYPDNHAYRNPHLLLLIEVNRKKLRAPHREARNSPVSRSYRAA